jgi:hypothetical protein
MGSAIHWELIFGARRLEYLLKTIVHTLTYSFTLAFVLDLVLGRQHSHYHQNR